MKTKTSPFYHRIFIAIGVVYLLSLGGITAFSSYSIHQKITLNNLISQKINSLDQKITETKNKLNKLKYSNKDCLIKSNSAFNLDKNTVLNKIDFENKIKKDIDKIKCLAFIKKASLPSHFLSDFDQKIFHTENTEKNIQSQQNQWILIKNILENIIIFPKTKIDCFDLKESSENSNFNNKIIQFSTLSIILTMRECYFQKLFNTLIKSNYFFIISSLTIFNSNPNPPLRHCVYSKESLFPILGNENITAVLKINLFDIPYSTDPCPERGIKNEAIISTNGLVWEYQKGSPPLFVSRHYATKNDLLIDPIEYPKMLCPPVPNEWLVSNNLDYSNPNILSEDIDQSGFTCLEKWQGDNPQEEPGKFPSYPNDPTSHPLLWTKLKCYQKDIMTKTYSLYFLGVEFNKTEKIFQIQPNIAFQSKSSHGKTIFDKKIRYVKMGEQIDGIPYKIINYQEKHTIYKKSSYNSSELIIEHLNTGQQSVLIQKTPYYPQPMQLSNIISIKIENTFFNPSHVLNLKNGDYFSLDYFLANSELSNQKNLIDTENYQLVDLSDKELTIERSHNRYRIPIETSEKSNNKYK